MEWRWRDGSPSFRGRKVWERKRERREEIGVPPRVGWCARLTRTVKSPPAPFSTALAIRIERQCQGQGRPSPPSRRILSLSPPSFLILLLSSCSVERTEHACVPPSFLRPTVGNSVNGWWRQRENPPPILLTLRFAIRMYEYPFFKFFESSIRLVTYWWKERGVWSVNMEGNFWPIFTYIKTTIKNPKNSIDVM